MEPAGKCLPYQDSLGVFLYVVALQLMLPACFLQDPFWCSMRTPSLPWTKLNWNLCRLEWYQVRCIVLFICYTIHALVIEILFLSLPGIGGIIIFLRNFFLSFLLRCFQSCALKCLTVMEAVESWDIPPSVQRKIFSFIGRPEGIFLVQQLNWKRLPLAASEASMFRKEEIAFQKGFFPFAFSSPIQKGLELGKKTKTASAASFISKVKLFRRSLKCL